MDVLESTNPTLAHISLAGRCLHGPHGVKVSWLPSCRTHGVVEQSKWQRVVVEWMKMVVNMAAWMGDCSGCSGCNKESLNFLKTAMELRHARPSGSAGRRQN